MKTIDITVEGVRSFSRMCSTYCHDYDVYTDYINGGTYKISWIKLWLILQLNSF